MLRGNVQARFARSVWALRRGGPANLSVKLRTPDGLRLAPVFLEDRPQDLIEIPAVALERAAEDAFLERADLAQRRIAAAVRGDRPGFEAVHADYAEREIDDGFCAFHEYAASPERRANRETPLRAAESRLELPHLKQSHRVLITVRHDGEAKA